MLFIKLSKWDVSLELKYKCCKLFVMWFKLQFSLELGQRRFGMGFYKFGNVSMHFNAILTLHGFLATHISGKIMVQSVILTKLSQIQCFETCYFHFFWQFGSRRKFTVFLYFMIFMGEKIIVECLLDTLAFQDNIFIFLFLSNHVKLRYIPWNYIPCVLIPIFRS